jgi:hypothetical protein
MSVAAALALLGLVAGPPAFAIASRLQAARYQKLADALTWHWDDREASLDFSIARYGGECTVEVLQPLDQYQYPRGVTIRMTRNGKQLCQFAGHRGTVFVRQADCLVYADYEPIDCGCTLVAIDLKTGERLWSADVGAIEVDHSVYGNSVRLDLNGDMIEAWGNEMAGQYLSIVDLRSGRVLAQRVYSEKWK